MFEPQGSFASQQFSSFNSRKVKPKKPSIDEPQFFGGNSLSRDPVRYSKHDLSHYLLNGPSTSEPEDSLLNSMELMDARRPSLDISAIEGPGFPMIQSPRDQSSDVLLESINTLQTIKRHYLKACFARDSLPAPDDKIRGYVQNQILRHHDQIITQIKRSPKALRPRLEVLSQSRKDITPEALTKLLKPAIKRKQLQQLAKSINLMEYQQAETLKEEGEKLLLHKENFWSQNDASTVEYRKDFPSKCWPMKHFRNFSVNPASPQGNDLLTELLQPEDDDETNQGPVVLNKVRRSKDLFSPRALPTVKLLPLKRYDNDQAPEEEGEMSERKK